MRLYTTLGYKDNIIRIVPTVSLVRLKLYSADHLRTRLFFQ
jgi:hypothetical protein